MPARNITFNGISNSFEWQVGNTTRFINFNTVTDVEYKEDCSTFYVYCGQTIVSVPNELREQFKAKYEEWKKQK